MEPPPPLPRSPAQNINHTFAQPAPKLPHSGFGIASFIISLVSGLALFVLIAAAGVIQATTPGGMDETSPQAMIIGLFLFAFIGLMLLALGFGIGGLCQKNRQKTFALLGVIFSAVGVLGTGLLMLVGLAAG